METRWRACENPKQKQGQSREHSHIPVFDPTLYTQIPQFDITQAAELLTRTLAPVNCPMSELNQNITDFSRLFNCARTSVIPWLS